MREIYSKVTRIAKKELYQFMKDYRVSTLNYHYSYYFEDCLRKHKIQLLEHHFSNRHIEGLTLIDVDGISFSYEKENPLVKQNFTKCHELGHFILGHSGSIFTEMKNASDSLQETEANLFSAFILMPDVVLLSKIYFRRDSFQMLLKDLTVSAEALEYRLRDLFRYHLSLSNQEVNNAINSYRRNDNSMILNYFELIKDQIVEEFKSIKANELILVLNYLKNNSFVASNKYFRLLENNFRKEIEEKASNIKTWVEYDFGQTIAYAWREDLLNSKQAKSRAKTILLLEKR
ncbi:TPA: ImmA/IrrE family metallo-endopeptidase [Streptococcus agalactiae]|uniref:Zn-dependent peptidase ImmA (M78 family) n=4 Tax=Streptococcus TaxID=1301 RepID=A0ABU0A5A1_STRDY|nr:ImmA/IrrE family metallo-endopeptidase [Streptococcus dysgalactiae]ADX24167.1 hypothetical protein SDE12394_03220 [Streptococcus dysgalactiae subsp. equisimilis ATCC 12394]MCY7207597.1 ImmA/IrrE family metallo-endopeptidase [Streptococcus dysgalactiae]MDQ0262453.1 Zn-dependent peptidase ImmA (M78 family) [Streptococcus dysgalactiae]QET82128.1 ImmA/IrrE family metallo-endopeptidase [Streptococcus dysgalactiae]QQC55932.1 ImmA/IrrE family metallo-endopeptidase [Streptococcus dysgalactiae]